MMNKDDVVAEFSLGNWKFNTVGQLPIGFSDFGSWIGARVGTVCGRDAWDYLKTIGVCSLEDLVSENHLVSVSDSFWVKPESDSASWADVSPFRGAYSEGASIFSLEGAVTGEGGCRSPVFCCQGSFPHAWVMSDDGPVLVKAGSKYTLGGMNCGREPYSEYYVSYIAKALGFSCVGYGLREYVRLDGRKDAVTECKCYTTEDVGAVPASRLGLKSYEDVLGYCESLGGGAYDEMLDMLFLDCLTLNTDRHLGNIEFLVNNSTQEVVGLAPIFDNNMNLLPYFVEGLDVFSICEYNVSDGRSFGELYALVKGKKDYAGVLEAARCIELPYVGSSWMPGRRFEFMQWLLRDMSEYLLHC